MLRQHIAVEVLVPKEAPRGVRLPLTSEHAIETLPVRVEDGATVAATFDLGNGSQVLVGAAFAKRAQHGLTPLGKAVVREMNRVGVVLDPAHATFAVAQDAVDVSTRPVMISHSNLVTSAVNHPRLITREHAALIATSGGILGSWPSGIDHVAIGTDMHANYQPVFRNYRDWSLIPAALLARGLGEKDVAKIMDGNFLRV